MKRNYVLLLLSLVWAINANALIVTVDEWGEVPEGGMEFRLEEAEEDPLTGELLMELKGTVLSNGPLKVTIYRSSEGIIDEFCCAGQCTAGNGEKTEVLEFTPEGVANWFSHHTPKAGGDHEVVTYIFTDSVEERRVMVQYDYQAQAVESVNEEGENVQKVIKDGILYIIRNNKTYTIQ